MKRPTKRKPDNATRLCSMFVAIDDARERATAKLENAEQLEINLESLARAMNDIASMAQDGLLDDSDFASIDQMFSDAHPVSRLKLA